MMRFPRSRLCDVIAKVLPDFCAALVMGIFACGLGSAVDPKRIANPDRAINIFLIGRSGCGKSFIGNHMVQALLNGNRSDSAIAAEEWIEGRGGLWKQCDCDGCLECPGFRESPSTSSSTENVTASTVVWTTKNNSVTRIRVFDSPGIPDTDRERMAEYHDKLILQMHKVGQVDAIVWVQSDVRVDAADRGFRVLLQQFHSFSPRVLLVNGKGHYLPTPIKKDRRPDKETYRAQLVDDWRQENEVGIAWHGEMFVSVDAVELDQIILPQVIAHVLALSSGRRHRANLEAVLKLKRLDVLWHDLVDHFGAITEREEMLKKLAEEMQTRLTELRFEIITIENKLDRWEEFLNNRVILWLIPEQLQGWLLGGLIARIQKLQAEREILHRTMLKVQDGHVTEYVSNRAEEIRDLCALLAKPDCPDVGRYISRSGGESSQKFKSPRLRKCKGPKFQPNPPRYPE